MLRDWKKEKESRIAFIRQILKEAGAEGVVFGNSGGKDSVLTGILCRLACDDVLGVIMPCGSKQNYGRDMDDARAAAEKFDIPTVVVDLTETRDALLAAVAKAGELSPMGVNNMAPRLRMNALYALAHGRKSLVAGTGNRSEIYMGYFTKWGDGAYDFNVIGDLTVMEIYDFLRYLGAPDSVIDKAPSAGLYEGQTDEQEMGVSYEAIDAYLLEGKAEPADMAVIERYHAVNAHKRERARIYGG
ncbi:MAG: NAD(+) synthase [Peptococcaceae bacterium]|nr:NAD(+) synthase [Peptococcaceae bacterium]